MGKLIGYKKFSNHKGNYCIMDVQVDYSAREKERGSVGSRVESFFVPEDKQHLLTPECIGKQIQIDYEVVGSRAYMSDFRFK